MKTDYVCIEIGSWPRVEASEYPNEGDLSTAQEFINVWVQPDTGPQFVEFMKRMIDEYLTENGAQAVNVDD